MRMVHTLLLKIIQDSQMPGDLRGMIRLVSSDDQYLFSNTEEFLALLKSILSKADPNNPDQKTQSQRKKS